MDANNNHSDKQPTLKEVREQRRLIQAQIELRQLQGARQILEAISNPDYYLTAYGDLLDRYRDGGRMAYPLTQPTDRRYGQNYPFWNTETDLSLLRAQARLLCTMNNYAIGLLNGLQAYVIGDGFQYRVVEKKKHGLAKPGKPSALVAETQDIIEEFCAVNDWHHWEQELFWRSREDGEYFLRYYPDRQLRCLTLRSVEPEQVTATGLPDPRPEWSFGILTEPEDMQEIYGYNVLYLSDPQNHQNEIREEVPADQIQHFKINVHRLVKRGLTDFCFSTYDALRMAEKLRNNMAEGAAVQSALAFLRQHESATQSQVQNFLNTQQLDFSRLNPLTGQAISYKHIEPGSIADIPRGMQYVEPPGAGNAAGFVKILHAALRGAGCRWNAPEWLATGSGADMAAYTASLTAQAPFVRTATQKQLSYKKAFTRVIKQAIATAVDFGRLPEEVFEVLDIQCEAPSIPYKSALDEAQANQIRIQGGWKSRQTVQQEEGLDPEREMQNIEEYNRRMGTGEKQGPVPVQEANFNPNEPRDERGRWTKGSDTTGANGSKSSTEYFPLMTSHIVTAFSSPVGEQPASLPRDNRPKVLVARSGQYLIIIYPDGHREFRLAPSKEDAQRILAELAKTFQILVPVPRSKPQTPDSSMQPDDKGPLGPFLGPQPNIIAKPTNKPKAISEMAGEERLLEAVKRALKYLGPELQEKLRGLFSPKSLALLATLFSVQLASHALGVGFIGDALAVAVLVVALGRDVIEVGSDMREFVSAALNAKNEEDLERAAEHLAKALTTAAIDLGMIAAAPALRAGARKVGQWVRPRLGKLRAKEPVPQNEPTSPETLAPTSPVAREVDVPIGHGRIRFTQGDVSPHLSDGKPIGDLVNEMRAHGWDPKAPRPDLVEFPDGGLVSLDHRRIVAARMAGIEKVPATVHPFNEPIPLKTAGRFTLDRNAGFTDPNTGIRYPGGETPKTWGEAAMFRAANQRVRPNGQADFPIEGSVNEPKILPPSNSGKGSRR